MEKQGKNEEITLTRMQIRILEDYLPLLRKQPLDRDERDSLYDLMVLITDHKDYKKYSMEIQDVVKKWQDEEKENRKKWQAEQKEKPKEEKKPYPEKALRYNGEVLQPILEVETSIKVNKINIKKVSVGEADFKFDDMLALRFIVNWV